MGQSRLFFLRRLRSLYQPGVVGVVASRAGEEGRPGSVVRLEMEDSLEDRRTKDKIKAIPG